MKGSQWAAVVAVALLAAAVVSSADNKPQASVAKANAIYQSETNQASVQAISRANSIYIAP